MNNTFRFMAVLATAAAVLASCAKAEIDSPAGENADGSNVYQGPVKTLTFTAQTGAPQTKTSLGEVVTDTDGNKTQPVLWEEGDEIKIMFMVDGTEYSVTATAKSVDGSSAVFEAKVPESGVENYYAVYPSVIESSIQSGETSELKVTIRTGDTDDPYQYGGFKNANIMVAKCQADAPQLNFKHACSIVRFKTGDTAPGQIFFYSGNRKANRGHAFINFEESGAIASISTESAEDKYVYVYAGKPDAEYYMPLWSDHTLEDGFIVAFRSSSFINTEAGWRVAYYPQDITLGRGEILDLGVIQNKIRTDYFVSTVAKGKMDGSSWENACDIAYVRNMFAKPADEDYAYAQQMKLENTNFWFAGNATFVFGTDVAPRLDMCFAAAKKANRCPINFYGGCIGTTGTDKARDPENHPTIFSGNGKYALFSVRNKTTLTLDGITLANTRAVNAHDYDGFYGGALYVRRLSSADDIYMYCLEAEYAPRVHVNNCIFRDNIQEGTTAINSNHDSGMAINIRDGHVYVNSCVFDGNIGCTRGGALRISNSSTGGSLYINNSYFTGNYNSNSASSYGTVMWCVDTDFKFAMSNCTFKDNVPPDGTTTGRGHMTINSPYVIVNSTIVESTDSDIEDQGLIRVSLGNSYVGSEAVHANNIIINTSANGNKYAMWYNGDFDYTIESYGYNMTSAINYASQYSNYKITASDYDKTGVSISDFANWSWLNESNCFSWTDYSTDGSLSDFNEHATAAQMIAATKANSKIGDDFYNWLVQIGAIVNDQFTDCRGYLRPKDAMCPGAYDPNATQPTL